MRSPFEIRLPTGAPNLSSDHPSVDRSDVDLSDAQSLWPTTPRTEQLPGQRARMPLETKSLGGGLPNVSLPSLNQESGHRSSGPNTHFAISSVIKDTIFSPSQALGSTEICGAMHSISCTQLEHESPAHVQVSLVSTYISRPVNLSKQLDAPQQVTEHSSWTAKDMKRSEEVYKTFDDEVPAIAHSVTVGEQTGSKTREQGQGPIIGAVQGAQIERSENESKLTLESMMLESMLRQVNARRQGSGRANDHFITFSPSALCSVATLFCNACGRETLSELWQELQKTCSVRSLSEVNEEHLARSRVIGSCRYGACSQVRIKNSIWIPKDRRVQKRFLDLSQHFYSAEIFCRYACDPCGAGVRACVRACVSVCVCVCACVRACVRAFVRAFI